MAFEDVFDNDLDTDHTFSGPVAGNWIAWRLSTVAAITGWRVAQMDPEVNSATSIAFFATNDADAYALVCSDGPTGDPPGDWTAIETVDVEAETDLTGVFAGGPHAYEYWFAEAIAGGDEAWHLHELAVTGASSDDFCGVGCDHKHHAEDVILADGTTVEDALAMAAGPLHTHPELIPRSGGGPEDINLIPSAGAALELDVTLGNWKYVVLDDALCELTTAGWPAGAGSSISLFLEMTAGTEDVDWGAIVWEAGVAPTLPTTPGAVFPLMLYTFDDGATVIGRYGAGAGGSVSEITDIPTAETDDTLVLAPDGTGGVEWVAPAGGAPSGAAGGQLSGTYPNPSVASSHSGSTHAATQAAAEATAAGDLAAHAAASDPHTGYVREADAGWVDLTDGGATTLHSHAGGGHPDLATHDTLGLATDAELATHAATAHGSATHEADATDAHDASAISIADAANDFTATEVEGALAELQAADEADEAALAAHLADTSDAHDASAISFTPEGSIAATDVQAAIQEVRDEAAAGGAPTDAQYLVGALHASLSAEKVRTDLYKNYHPDNYPAGLNAASDEFDDSSLDGAWTWDTAPAGAVSESLYPGFLNILGGTNASANERKLRKAFAPGAATAFSAAAKVRFAGANGNFSTGVGLYILSSADAIISGVAVSSDGTTTGAKGHRMFALAGGSTQWPAVAPIVIPMAGAGALYLLITRTTADVYVCYWSADGMTWQYMGTHTTATTVAKVAIAWAADTDAADTEANYDFVRVFNAVTRKIGA